MAGELLIRIKNLYKHYGEKVIFEDANVNINLGQKIAVIGRNGAGKTTLFKMILGQSTTDRNSLIEIFPITKIGYLQQKTPFLPDDTVQGFLERETGKEHWQIQTVLRKFDFKETDFERNVSEFSGGWQMRIKLSLLLLHEPNCIFLDEPTNYLDLQTLVLLENFLLDLKGTVLVISHDREFLKKTCDTTMEVDHTKIRLFSGTLEEYLEEKEVEKEKALIKNKNVEKKQKQLQTFVDRYGAKASKAAAAQSKVKHIERLEKEKISIGRSLSNVVMRIPQIEAKKGNILDIENLKIGYGEKVVAGIDNLLIGRGTKVAIVGENGQGKTTFLKTIAGILKPLSGNFDWKNSPKIAYYHQQTSHDFFPDETLLQYVKRKVDSEVKDQEVLSMLGSFLFKREDYTKETQVLSGGEQSRLYLACMFLSKADVYLLDEPTNHLDIETVEVMARAIKNFNGTVFFVSHDRTFVNIIADTILEVGGGKIRLYSGNYEYYVWMLEKGAREINQTKNSMELGSGRIVENVNLHVVSKQGRKDAYLKQKKIKNLEVKIAKLGDEMRVLEQKISGENFDEKMGKEYEELKEKLDAAETEYLTLLD